jgi:hypothetical protein
MQIIIVIVALAAAGAYLARRLFKRFSAKSSCSGACGCKEDIALRFRQR